MPEKKTSGENVGQVAAGVMDGGNNQVWTFSENHEVAHTKENFFENNQQRSCEMNVERKGFEMASCEWRRCLSECLVQMINRTRTK